MADNTIKFTVNEDNIAIDETPEEVKPKETVVFKSTNQTVYVTFDGGYWPFVGIPEVIEVPGGGASTEYTVRDDVKKVEIDAYEVATENHRVAASGRIDIEP